MGRQDTTTAVVTVGEAVVPYYVSGAHNSETPPLVLVHGTGGTMAKHFATLGPMLAEHHRVIGMDLSDSVRNDTDGLTVDDLVAQIRAVIVAAAPGEQVALIGYSLGAMASAATAARYPELVAEVVLIAGFATTDPFLRLKTNLWAELYARSLYERDDAALVDYMIQSIYGSPFLASKSWREIEGLRAEYSVGPGSSRQMALASDVDIARELTNVQARTLVIGCTYDALVPIKHSRELFGLIHDAYFAEVQCGHAVLSERPAELFGLVHRFVTRQGTSRIIGENALLQQLSGHARPKMKEVS